MCGPEARAPFDAILESVPAAPDVRTENATVGGVRGWWCRPADAHPHVAILFLHGGTYVVGTARASRNFASQIASRARAATFIPEYRLAPEHPFPAAVYDSLSAYGGLVDQGTERIALVGESAGGGLALVLLSMATERATTTLPCPRGAAVISPWTDLALTGESMKTRADADPLLTRDGRQRAARLYLAGHDAIDPLASPLYGALSGLPPIRIDVGEDEILLDDSRRYAKRARAAGVDVTLAIWQGMPHSVPSKVGKLRAADLAIEAIGRFLGSITS